MRKLFKDYYAAITDPKRDFSERVFLILTAMSELAALIALVGDYIFKENIYEIITLIATLVMVPVVTIICLYRDKLKIASRILIAALIFLIVPALFFFGGGLKGGGIFWIIFSFMYVGIVISGGWRVFMLFLLSVLTAVCFLAGYYHPELIYQHSKTMFYVDSFISVILVGFVCHAMTLSQARLFKEENERAKKEAERAEELTRAQNRFFSNMSHEIRTPINSILGLNELILRDHEASDEIVKEAQGIQGAGKMLLALINDILDFSKMEAGSMDIVPVDYNVGDLLSEIVNMVWQRAYDKGLQFEVNVDPNVPAVLYGDEVRIKQILINLLNNAVKYTAEGSVELHMESEEVDEENVQLIISVTDTGMGIKKESLPYLFDAFKRVDEEKNRRIEGTGLGLSIVRQLVELMGGTVTVNSVYGEGSTFSVVLKQRISDHTKIGELSIHDQQTSTRKAYEPSFRAPDARILIVDDNEMNLEVECRLLAGTEMTIDRAMSGRDALEMTLKTHYDAIFMDHLMPEMDGIECLERLRNQSGGLNRTTPVLVLTANAGSDTRDLYNRAGFEGYLIKPVSGDALESALIRFIDKEKVFLTSRMSRMREDIHTAAGYSGKLPVIITSYSVCDLPDSIIRKLRIPVIPALIRTDEGVFKDGVQMDAGELIRHIDAGKNAVSFSGDEAAYTEFFAEALKKAHHLIHISVTSSMSDDYKMACEAAKAFDNVTVINSGCLSSATGLLVLIAVKLAQQNMPVDQIIAELEAIKPRLKCSFVVDTTQYMAKKGFVSPLVHKAAQALNLHPALRFRDDKGEIGGIWLGSTKRAYRRYIHKAFPVDVIPDSDVAFVTYVDMPTETLLWIREEIRRVAYFEHVVFEQASAAISSNCGPGTFGILYFVKGNKSYNIGSFFQETEEGTNEKDEGTERTEQPVQKEETAPDQPWYRKIEGINWEVALKNSGSEEALRTVVQIFYDSIPEKTEELNRYYGSEDWENYTIKVHALKSSAKLIGALLLSEKAQKLENAGKEKDVSYIREHHEAFMQDYGKYTALFAPEFGGRSEKEKPVADDALMESVYEGLREAAEAMDCGQLDDILAELEEYGIPESEQERFADISAKAKNYDYEGILQALQKKG